MMERFIVFAVVIVSVLVDALRVVEVYPWYRVPNEVCLSAQEDLPKKPLCKCWQSMTPADWDDKAVLKWICSGKDPNHVIKQDPDFPLHVYSTIPPQQQHWPTPEQYWQSPTPPQNWQRNTAPPHQQYWPTPTPPRNRQQNTTPPQQSTSPISTTSPTQPSNLSKRRRSWYSTTRLRGPWTTGRVG